MKDQSFVNIQTRDAIYKIDLYFSKILKANGSIAQIQKICHLAAQICLKYSDKSQFAQQISEKLQNTITETKNYFILYLFDILIKGNHNVMKIGLKYIQALFKLVWNHVYNQQKNNSTNLKLQCLKAMAKTWGVIYNQKVQSSIRKWLQTNYKVPLVLQDKNQKIFNQNLQKYRLKQVLTTPTKQVVKKIPQNNNTMLEQLMRELQK